MMGKAARMRLLGKNYQEKAIEDDQAGKPNALDLKKERQKRNSIISKKQLDAGFWDNLGIVMAQDGSLRPKVEPLKRSR